MIPLNTEQRFCEVGTLLDTDEIHVLVPPEDGVQLFVTYARLQGAGVISNDTVHVQDDSGAVQVLNLPAFVPDRGDEFTIGPLVEGIKLTKNEGLVIIPNAGFSPHVHVIVEGYKLRG